MELLQTLGIDPKLLLAQVVNFTILLLVLWKVAYKPLLKLMNERSQRIEKSLQDAKLLEQERAQWKQEHEQLVAKTKQETRQLMADAKAQAETMRKEARERLEQEFESARGKNAQELKAQEQRAMKELEERMTALVADVAGRFLSHKVSTKDDEALIEEALAASKKT